MSVNLLHIRLMPDTSTQISAADSRTYTISELAREFNLTPRALRFYEDKDMLHPARDGMTRVYRNRDKARLKIIVRLKRLGLPLADIREILDLYAVDKTERAQLQMGLVKFKNQIVELTTQREDIDSALAELKKGIIWIEEKLETYGPSDEDKAELAAFDAIARKQLDDA